MLFTCHHTVRVAISDSRLHQPCAAAAVLFAAVVPCLAVIHVAGVPHGRVEGQEDGVGHVAEVEAVATAPVAAAGAGAGPEAGPGAGAAGTTEMHRTRVLSRAPRP